jgi:hypothetical protein
VTDWQAVPGYVSHRDGPEMPTVTIETGRIREACEHARDELGFNVCVDLVATDYLDWGGKASPATSAPRAAGTSCTR